MEVSNSKQSRLLEQVWLRKNDWWRYAIIVGGMLLIDLYLEDVVRVLVPYSVLEPLNSNQIPNLGKALVLGLLFVPLHRAPLYTLAFIRPQIRPGRLVMGLGIGMVLLVLDGVVNALFAGVEELAFNPNLSLVLQNATWAFLTGLAFWLNAVVYLGYLLGGLLRWSRLVWLSFALVWLFLNILTLKSMWTWTDLSLLPYILVNGAIFFILFAWQVWDDGFELLGGYMVGVSLFSSALFGTTDSESDPNTLVYIVYQSEPLGYFGMTLVRMLVLFLVSAWLYRYFNWSQGRARLFRRYEPPTFTDDWTQKISEIGNKK